LLKFKSSYQYGYIFFSRATVKPGADLVDMELHHLMTCPGHVSSVRALCPAMYVPDHRGYLVLFSGGGRASLKCWHVVFHTSQGVLEKEPVDGRSSPYYFHAHSVAELNQSLQWHRKHVKQSDESESRVMALTAFHSNCLACTIGFDDGYIVISGWSNGQIRFHHFSDKRRNFMCLLQLAFHDHCILSVTHLAILSERGRDQSMVIAVTAATDGQIALWDCQELFSCHTDSSNADKVAPYHQYPIFVYKAHQSGVNDMAIAYHSELGGWLLVSGGDDNSLYGTLLKNPTEPCKVGWCTAASGLHPHAHCSSITGVAINNVGDVISVSVDQTIRKWSILVTDKKFSSDTMKSLEWKLLQCCFTSVADVSALILLPKGYIGVCGVGIEIIKFDCPDSDKSQQTTEHSL
jgi:WD40 repeat protein